MGLVIFIIFMSEIDSGMECTLNKSDDDTKLRGATDTTEGTDVIQRDPNKREKWVNVNLMRFNKPKCKVLNMGWGNPRYVHRLGKDLTESISAEQDLGALMDKTLDIRKQCALAAQRRTASCAATKGAGQHGEGVVCPTCSDPITPHMDYCIEAWGSQHKKDVELLESI